MVIYKRGKVAASTKTVKADDEIIEENVEDVVEEGPAEDVIIEPEATDLLFEVEDVAELISEITGQPVDVSAEEDMVEFAVGEDVFTVEAEGDEEILEAASKKKLENKKTVKASTRTRRVVRRK